jgi:hypothetical protein
MDVVLFYAEGLMKKFLFIEIIFFAMVIVLFAAAPGSTGDSCTDACERMSEQCKQDCNDSWDWFRGGCNCVLCEMELKIKAPPGACSVSSALWISHENTDYIKDPIDNDGDLVTVDHTNEGGGFYTRYIELDNCIYPQDDFDITKADLHTSAIYICAPADPCTNYPDYRYGYTNNMKLKNLISSYVSEYNCDLIVEIDISNTDNITWLKFGNQKCFPCCEWN